MSKWVLEMSEYIVAEEPLIARTSIFAVILLTIVLIRVLASRLLGVLVSRGTISPSMRDIFTRVIDIALVLSGVSAAVMIFIPEYWGILVVFSILGIVALVILIYPLSSYVALIVIQLGLPLRNRFYEILLPGSRKPLNGRIVDTTPQYVLLEDARGETYYIPNNLLARAVFKQSVARVRLRLTVELKKEAVFNGLKLEALNELILGVLRDYRHPGFKDSKRVLQVRVSSDKLEYLVVMYPLSLPIREDDVARVMVEVTNMLREKLGERAGDISVTLSQAE